jgi:hypothetical protein
LNLGPPEYEVEVLTTTPGITRTTHNLTTSKHVQILLQVVNIQTGSSPSCLQASVACLLPHNTFVNDDMETK